MWESLYRAIVFLQEKSLVIDWGCSTWDNCQNKTAWTVLDIYEWGTGEAGERWKRAEGRKSGKMEEWGWPVRWGERKNFSMMKQSVLLSYWPTLPPIARPAPWQQALSPREKQPYRTTPPYFLSLSLSWSRLLSPFTSVLDLPVWEHDNTNPALHPQLYIKWEDNTHTTHSAWHASDSLIRTRSRVAACTRRALPFLVPLLA